MKTSSIVSAFCALCLIASPVAFAQKALGPKARLMAKYDLNKNNVIDGDEMAAVRKDFAAEPAGDLKRYDANANGKLEDAEIAEMKPPGAKAGGDAKKGGGKKAGDTKAAKPAAEVAPAKPTTP
jgi:hypothetical protein